MQKQSWTLVIVALVLAVLYATFFTDWLRTDGIQIIVQNRPIPQRLDLKRTFEATPVYPVSFAFDRKYEFTSVKVVSERDLATQKFPSPIWHLISETNSRPTKAIVYGVSPPGMHPAVEESKPQPLIPGTRYMLLLEAGRLKGATNFSPIKASIARQ